MKRLKDPKHDLKMAALFFGVGVGTMLWGFHDGLTPDRLGLLPSGVKNNDIILGGMSLLSGICFGFIFLSRWLDDTSKVGKPRR